MEPKCIACGECCKSLTINVGFDTNVMEDLFRIHYGKDVDRVVIKVKHRCPHLDKYNRCEIYDDPKRPEICRTWYCKAAKGEEPHAIRLSLEDK